MARRHREPAYGGNVTSERQPQLTRREIPNFDDAVTGTGCKPFVTRLDGNAAHPTQVPRNDAHELPWCVIRRLDSPRGFVQRERLGEC